MQKWVLNSKLITRRVFLVIYDILAVVVAAFAPLVTRYEFQLSEIPSEFINSVWWILPIAIITTLLIFYLLRLYHSLWAYAGVTEMQNMVVACIISAAVQAVILLVSGHNVPRSYYFIYALCQIGRAHV